MASWFAAAPSAWFAQSPTQLADARDRAEADGMPATCSIVAWLTMRNARGQTINRAERVRATAVPCRIERDLRPVFGAESGGAYGRTGEIIDTSAQAFRIALPWGTDVRESDHIVLDGDGSQFEVSSVDDVSSFGTEVIVGGIRLGIENPQEGE
jgi:hypothetical protein